MCQSFKKQYGLDYLIWRPFNIITEKEIASFGVGYSHVFAEFIANLIGEKDDVLSVLGNGQQVRCFTWIDDVARLIAEESFGVTKHRCYNIGTVRNTSMIQLAEMIHDIGVKLGIRENKPLKFSHMEPFPNDVLWRMPNVDRITNEFGFKPSIALEKALEECVMYYLRKNVKW